MADRISNFIFNPGNYQQAILEGLVLCLVPGLSWTQIGQIIGAASAIDLCAHTISPGVWNSSKSLLTTTLTAYAGCGHWVPLALYSLIRL